MDKKKELVSWEFEGPVDFMKQLAKLREIPREPTSDLTRRSLSIDSQSTNSSNRSTTGILQTIEVQGTDLSDELTTIDGFAKPKYPAFQSRPRVSNQPPLPPGPPPLRADTSLTTNTQGPRGQPPLPPGPPPSRSVVTEFRKAAPVPDFIKAGPPPPTSVSAFKEPPAFVRRQSSQAPQIQTPFPSGMVAPNVAIDPHKEKARIVKRPRGLSLSSSLRRSMDSYEKVCQVGGGTYGDVFKARDRETGDIVALKKVRLEDEQEGFPVTALREIKFLSQARHLNIVNLKEVVSSKASDATRNKGSVFMVFEYAECDLVGLMKQATLSESHIMCLVKQLLQAVHFAHVNHVLHRDIKPSNILVNSTGILKLADWGLCRRWIEGSKLTNRVVTRWYRAPELLLGEQQYSGAIDMWAVGCVMAELLIGRALLPGKDDLNQLKLVFELCGKPSKETMPTGWENLPGAKELLAGESTPSQLHMRFAFLRPEAKDLILRMLELDPAKRISAKDALSHDWFWGNDPAPCDPSFLPIPKGDGLHEYQLREEAARKEKERRQQEGAMPHEKRWKHGSPIKHQ